MDEAAFWDGIAERYAARKLDDEAAYEATLARVRHWLPPEARVLELGCGTGSTARRLAPHVAEVVASDYAAEMLRIGRARAETEGLGNLTFEQAEAGVAGGGALFDVVCCFNLLHLVPDRAALLAQVRARLVAEGLFISKTPCLGHKPWLWPLVQAMRCVGKAPKVAGWFKVAELEVQIRAAGFEILEQGDYPAGLPNHFVVARRAA